ncbi:MAG: response regulator transcription factor [Spirochaetales bacterium]|jgi:DNA-binding CsgD family transcriptional regulator|nr:response regulator transcription factor [Spirochaetales bacterium]
MYRIAVIDNNRELYNRLQKEADRRMPGLLAFEGPFTETETTADAVVSVDNDEYEVSQVTLRVPKESPANDDTSETILKLDGTRPIRILAALLASLLDFDVKDLLIKTPSKGRELTARESDVLNFIAAGYTNKEIAGFLGITERTIKFHVSEILAKLNVSGRTEAVVEAAKMGIITL